MITTPPDGFWPLTRVCETEDCRRKGIPVPLQVATWNGGAVAVPTLVCLGCKQPMSKPDWADL